MAMIDPLSWMMKSAWTDLAFYTALCFLLLALLRALYNIFLHPLAGFPGPLLARASFTWRLYHSLRGYFHFAIEKQHQIHGPVFRVSPNELSFASVRSWTDIYNPPSSRQATCIKSDFYDMYGSGFAVRCIGSERNPMRHSAMKRTLAPAFASRALAQQENSVHECVDIFVNKIGLRGCGNRGIDMTDWFEMVAFDVLGSLAFGESFHSVEDEKPHFWSQLVVKHFFYVTLLDNLQKYPIVKAMGQALLPWFTVSVRNKHVGYTRRQVQKRLQDQGARSDLLTNIVGEVEKGEMSLEQLTAHVSTLVIAGGETVATFLTSTTYHLLKNPQALEKLTIAIRNTFDTYAAIDARSAQQIPYIQAVISEGLRIAPPGSQGFPRISPGASIDGHWVPEGVEIYTSAWTVTHDSHNFKNPYEFRPERWLDPDSTDNREASQPFSLGPRGCLGRQLAYDEMAIVLAKMLWRYDIFMAKSEVDWERDCRLYVMWDKPQLWVRFQERSPYPVSRVAK